ncbi:NAD(P)H-binding protein [Pediococcus claussenii]|uniref:NAD(P)-binding domain-containing protein n=1 Tax=Pediococcus claussenii (strain ATCC BAA-344 / DSM 14800 / JCM 18046 / KCTC 3811 / LMG 21948 / P06) TaxID=701521 RepID=G8PC84_PEDCP|nr:NAD(P)H-binding protein [Pediococcus claussenii]AEV96062.1 hypothetical protein PECL_1850 [Pediococcus claussenii ATCC BAA-344]ANZ69546.1 hypothetical protein AYR57_04115 [Pediococcus claussenii]ANZ71363.1 hypothetical protein AYR58_04120 [Pediococcus claussenii]KRN19414.1 hypothetical protein IV79_GL001466 [Pediococcus claussenii]
MRILELGNSREIENKIFGDGKKVTTAKLLDPTFNLSEFNGSYDVIVTDIMKSGMDDFGNRLADSIQSGDISTKKIVVISTAGIDQEITPKWIGTSEKERGELLLESRYFNKLIDELEIPYVILRPVKIVDGNNSEIKLSSEGTKMKTQTIGRNGLLEVINQAIFENKFDNTSIGISN